MNLVLQKELFILICIQGKYNFYYVIDRWARTWQSLLLTKVFSNEKLFQNLLVVIEITEKKQAGRRSSGPVQPDQEDSDEIFFASTLN